MNKQRSTTGFTIIEVVLVLAIAGLIFLMVFLALPALQSGQRDTARKQDVGTVSTAIANYSDNNRGSYPNTAQLETELVKLSGTPTRYERLSNNITKVTITSVAVPSGGLGPTIPEDEIVVYLGAKCAGSVGANGKVNLVDGTARQYAVTTRLEGSSKSGYCL